MKFNKIEIGIIKDINYNTGVGHIITQDKLYLFLIADIKDEQILEVGDYVKFRGEYNDTVYRAFFIKKINKNT